MESADKLYGQVIDQEHDKEVATQTAQWHSERRMSSIFGYSANTGSVIQKGV